MKAKLALVFCMILLIGSVSALTSTKYYDLNVDGNVSMVGDLMFQGNMNERLKFTVDPDTGMPQFKRLIDTLWQPGSMEWGTGTVWVGKNVGLGGFGHNLVTETSDGHIHTFAIDEFDGYTSQGEIQVPNAYLYIEDYPFQPDDSGEWTGSTFEFVRNASTHSLIKSANFKIGATGATQPIRFRVWKGSNDSGIFIFDHTYPTSNFPADSISTVVLVGYLEFDEGDEYFLRFSSGADFSLKTNAAGTEPWFEADASLVRNEVLLQTQQWANGTNFTDGQYLILNRTIYVATITGVQTGTFESNLDKWDALGHQGTNNYWTKTGNDLSYSLGNAIITNGVISAYGPGGIDSNFVAGDSSGYNLITGAGNVLIGDAAGTHLTDEDDNTCIGEMACNSATGLYDAVGLGSWALVSADGVNRTVAIGGNAGYGSSGINGVYLGYEAGKDNTIDNKLFISNILGDLIEGSFADEWLKVYGDLEVISNGFSNNAILVNNSLGNTLFYVREDSDGDGQIDIHDKSGNIKVQILSNRSSYFNGGNVGIGTNSPAVNLDVAGSAFGGQSLQVRSGDSFEGEDASQIIFSYHGTSYDNEGYAHSIRTRHSSTMDDGNAIDFWLWNTDTTNSSTLGDERVMTINGEGNVGIGTSIPSVRLEIDGDVGIGRVAGGYTFREVVGGAERAGIHSNAFNELIFNYANQYEGMRINVWGDIGIGTNNPQAKLHINSSNPQIYLSSNEIDSIFMGINDDGIYQAVLDAINPGYEVYVGGNGFYNLNDHFYYNATTEYFGMGTKTPSSRLNVIGDLNVTGHIYSPSTYDISLQGLVLDLNFNDNSINGDTVLDSSGEHNHGTVYGAIHNSTAGFNGGGAYEFHSVGRSIGVFDDDSLNVGASSYTLTAWVYPTEFLTGLNPIINKLTGSNDKEFALSITNSGEIRLEIEKQSNNAYVQTVGAGIVVDNWYNIVATFNHRSMKVNIYVNGVVQTTTGTIPTLPIDTTYDIMIGDYLYGSERYTGTIDEVRIYNRIISNNEIKKLHSQRIEGIDSYVFQKDIQINTQGNIVGDVYMVGDLDVGSINVRNPDSITLDGVHFTRFNTSFGGAYYTGVLIDDNFGVKMNTSGSATLSVINYDSSNNSNSILSASNNQRNSVSIFKFSSNHNIPNLGAIYGNNGKLKILGQRDSNDTLSGIEFSFTDGSSINPELQITGFANETTVMSLFEDTVSITPNVIITNGSISAYGAGGKMTNHVAGERAGMLLTLGYGNVLAGYEAGRELTHEDKNVFIGYKTGEGAANLSNAIGLGAYAMLNAVDAEGTIGIGYYAGEDSTATDSIYIGYEQGKNNFVDNKLFIGNYLGTLIEGDFDESWVNILGDLIVNGDLNISDNLNIEGDSYFIGNIGIGTNNPQAKLMVKTGIADDGIFLIDDLDAPKVRLAIDGDRDGYLELTDQNNNNVILLSADPSVTSYFYGIGITDEEVLSINGPDLTTGKILHIYSDSSDVNVRNLLDIHNDNTAAIGAVPLAIQQDANTEAFEINALGVTTDDAMKLILNSLTTGTGLKIYSNAINSDVRSLLYLHNDNVAAVEAIPLRIKQDAPDRTALQIDSGNLLMNGGSNLEIYSGDILVYNGGDIFLDDGGEMRLDNGAHLNVNGGGDVNINGGNLVVNSGDFTMPGSTGMMILPRRTTTYRDSISPTNGMIFYSTTNNRVECFENNAWVGCGA